MHLVAVSKAIAVEDRIADALQRVKGAYSLLFLTEDAVIAVRDPMGIRPLCLGLLPGSKDAHVIASEPCAFDLIGAEYVRDVEPGEMVIIDASGMRSIRPLEPAPRRAVRLRVRLLRAARLAARRTERLRGAKVLRRVARRRASRSRPTW